MSNFNYRLLTLIDVEPIDSFDLIDFSREIN